MLYLRWPLMILCFTFLFTTASMAETKPESSIATISVREVLIKSNQGIEIIKDFDKKFEGRKRQLAEQEQELQALQKEVVSSNSKPAKQQEFKAKQEKFHKNLQQFNQDVEKAEAEAFKPVVEKVRQVLLEYSKEKKLIALQERSQFVFSDPNIDVTEEIIKRVNQK